jgi:hypothetical protein
VPPYQSCNVLHLQPALERCQGGSGRVCRCLVTRLVLECVCFQPTQHLIQVWFEGACLLSCSWYVGLSPGSTSPEFLQLVSIPWRIMVWLLHV